MGIDIYMSWDDQTDDEKQAQYTGFSITSGDVGYLREAYHGEPYATDVLVPESFEWTKDIGELMDDARAAGSDLPDDLVDLLARGVPMQAEVLRERLADTLLTVEQRIAKVYPDSSDDEIRMTKQAFVDFVKLAEAKQAEGRNVYVYASY